MRIAPSLFAFALLTAPAAAQTLSAELLTEQTIMPTTTNIMGPVGLSQMIGPQLYTAVPVNQTLPVQLDWFSGAPGQFSTQTSEGATSLVYPSQSVQLRLDPATPFICAGGRPCTVLTTSPVVLEAMVETFEITLIEPVPDPEGGCETISGMLNAVTAIQLTAPLVTLTVMPSMPPTYAPVPPPEMPPVLLPETQHMFGPVTANLLPAGAVDVRICGDAPDRPEGRLSYTLIQGGTDWRWETSGEWIITYNPDGQAIASHELLGSNHEGLLIDVYEGDAQRLEMDWSEALTPGGEEAYRVSFDPDPSAFESWILEFAEPSGLPHATGQTNTQSVNHPGALAISYLFRHYLDGADAVLPMTPDGPEDVSPSFGGPAGPPLELTLNWEQAEP